MTFRQLITWCFLIAVASSLALGVVSHPGDNSYIVLANDGVQIEVPKKPLASGSLVIATSEPKNYLQWTDNDISISYALLQKVVESWRQIGTSEHFTTDQFLVYGGQHFRESTPDSFQWEIVPYYQSVLGKLGSFQQQTKTLKGIVFGGAVASEESLQETQNFYREHIQEDLTIHEVFQDAVGDDPFCNPDRIARQRVLEGTRINILFNYAPIGFGGERLHFLLVPKAHRGTFNELSLEEYQEVLQLSQLLMAHFRLSRTVHDVYLYHKTGVDAGQTVPHWHMHMVFMLSETQAFMGKLTVLKNMLFSSSPMNDEELRIRIAELIEEFKDDQNLLPYSVHSADLSYCMDNNIAI